MLDKLTTGIIRVSCGSGSGALRVVVDGRLYAHAYDGSSYPYDWAFGARPAPESKN